MLIELTGDNDGSSEELQQTNYSFRLEDCLTNSLAVARSAPLGWRV